MRRRLLGLHQDQWLRLGHFRQAATAQISLQPSVATATTSSVRTDAESTLNQQQLSSAVDAVWPYSDPVSRACRLAALHLAASPGYRDTIQKVTGLIATAATGEFAYKTVVAFRRELPGKSFAKFLKEGPFFRWTTGGKASEGGVVMLDLEALIQTAGQQQTALQQPHKSAQLLTFVQNRQWHSDRQLAVARQAVAAHILAMASASSNVAAAAGGLTAALEPGKYSVSCSEAAEIMQEALQTHHGWKPGDAKPYKSLQQAFKGDPYLSTYSSKPSQLSVRLNIVELMRDAAAWQDSRTQASASHISASSPNMQHPLLELPEWWVQLLDQRTARSRTSAAAAAAAAEQSTSVPDSSSSSSDTNPSSNHPVSSKPSRPTLFEGHQPQTKLVRTVAGRQQLQSNQAHVQCMLLKLQHHSSGWYLPEYTALGSNQGANAGGTTHTADDLAADQADAADESVASILELLPQSLHEALQPYATRSPSQPYLIEIMADAGHPVQIKLSDHTVFELPITLDITDALQRLAAARQDLSSYTDRNDSDSDSNSISSSLSSSVSSGVSSATDDSSMDSADCVDHDNMFGSDNRMGVPGTLHRISAMRDRKGGIIGLTYRVGRHVPGIALMLADVLSSMKASIKSSNADRPQSLLILGRPRVGKTTLLRDIARIMSLPPEEGGLGLAVVIVDTSNEIAGDADQRHPCIGRARRMMVPRRNQQAAVLVEAVQNHGPDVIIVDEIGTRQEVEAARTIAQRGVLLIGTAHGATLSNLLKNPELRPLVGGVVPVTVGDATAQASNWGQKTKLERAGAATFFTLLELQQKNRWRLHLDVEQSVDILLGAPSTAAAVVMEESCNVNTQTRSRAAGPEHCYRVVFHTDAAVQQALAAADVLKAAANGIDV